MNQISANDDDHDELPLDATAALAEQFGARDDSYRFGFTTNVAAESFTRGLNPDIVRAISEAREEPDFLLKFRLKAFDVWMRMKEPTWSAVHYPPIDYQAIQYFSKPKAKAAPAKPTYDSLDEVDPEIIATLLMPSAMPRSWTGKASVRIADELAMSSAPPRGITREQAS